MNQRALGLTALVCWLLVAYFVVVALVLDRDANAGQYHGLAVLLGVVAGACAVPGIVLGLVVLRDRDRELMRQVADAAPSDRRPDEG
jgi:ABC-type branched-subunit amino acid transport system permease subunit